MTECRLSRHLWSRLGNSPDPAVDALGDEVAGLVVEPEPPPLVLDLTQVLPRAVRLVEQLLHLHRVQRLDTFAIPAYNTPGFPSENRSTSCPPSPSLTATSDFPPPSSRGVIPSAGRPRKPRPGVPGTTSPSTPPSASTTSVC